MQVQNDALPHVFGKWHARKCTHWTGRRWGQKSAGGTSLTCFTMACPDIKNSIPTRGERLEFEPLTGSGHFVEQIINEFVLMTEKKLNAKAEAGCKVTSGWLCLCSQIKANASPTFLHLKLHFPHFCPDYHTHVLYKTFHNLPLSLHHKKKKEIKKHFRVIISSTEIVN